ncbi:MAG: hypothetical protein JNK32_04025, partial [Anaerolineales bacterium]|nr:hypothetical protein [Anaerolineales bacterium]
NTFDLDDMFTQMNSGNINTNILQESGMVREVSRLTGMDEANAAKTLDTTLSMFGKKIQTGTTKAGASARYASALPKRSLNSAKIKSGKLKR